MADAAANETNRFVVQIHPLPTLLLPFLSTISIPYLPTVLLALLQAYLNWLESIVHHCTNLVITFLPHEVHFGIWKSELLSTHPCTLYELKGMLDN